MVSTKRLSVATSPMSTVQLKSSQTATPLSTKVANSPTKSKAEPKFSESERVLCYEPDPTKVEVIYDAKVLQVAEDIDPRGKVKGHQYLVHFQGWNASWDRFVPEEFLLKDNPENRELQRNLLRKAEEARIMNNKKKKKKKKIRRSSQNGDEAASLNSSTASSTATPTLLANGDANGDADTDAAKLGDENNSVDRRQKEEAANRCGSPKKKKKKKRKDKKEKLYLAEVLPEDQKQEPRIGKIVIVNGSKIQTSPVASIQLTCAATPPPLRSASPKITLKPDKNSEVQDKLAPEEEAPLESGTEVNKRRKRKLSSVDTTPNRVIKSVKRRRTSAKDNSVVANAISASDAIAATAALAKPSSFLKCKDERMSFKPPPTTSTVTAPTPPPTVLNGKRREISNGCTSINLSENLKRHLTNDFEMVKKKRRLNVLPAVPNIVNVLEDFVRHYSAGRLVAFEKHQRKSLYTTHRRENGEVTLQRAMESIQMCKEVAEGLRILIDFNLQRVLLYRTAGELDQHEEVMRKGLPPREPPPQVSFTGHSHDIEVAIFNGNSPTISSSADSANSITCTKTLTRPLRKSEPPTSADTVQPLNDVLSKRRPAMMPTSLTSRRPSADNMFSTRSSTTSNKDGGDSSCSTNSRSTATNRTSILMPPVAASPSTPAAIKVMRNIENWKLVPDELYCASPPMPSLVYGPIYLLRLFVKLPEILKRMNFPPKTSKLIVKYMDAVLEYFEGHPDLFSCEMYEL